MGVLQHLGMAAQIIRNHHNGLKSFRIIRSKIKGFSVVRIRILKALFLKEVFSNASQRNRIRCLFLRWIGPFWFFLTLKKPDPITVGFRVPFQLLIDERSVVQYLGCIGVDSVDEFKGLFPTPRVYLPKRELK